MLDYINDAEQHESQPHTNPTCASRVSKEKGTDWYMLGENIPVADFIFPSKIGEKYRLIDNRNASVYADKVNYNIVVKEKYQKYSSLIFLYLNSITFRYFLDLFSRQLTGSQTLSDVDVNLVENTLIIKPELLAMKKTELKDIYNSLKEREQDSIFNEIEKDERRKLDAIIFELLDLERADVYELYDEAVKLVSKRKTKSESIKNSKNKRKFTYLDALNFINEKFDDIVKYIDLIRGMKCREYTIKNLPIRFPANYKYDNGNMFDEKIYINYIIDDRTLYPLVFDNTQQVRLFQFLIEELDIKDMKIQIPIDVSDCAKVLKVLKGNFENIVPQMKSLLKLHRIRFNEVVIYRNIAFEL